MVEQRAVLATQFLHRLDRAGSIIVRIMAGFGIGMDRHGFNLSSELFGTFAPWFKESRLRQPTSVQSGPCSFFWNIKVNTQVSNAGRYATNRKNTIPAGVSGLLGLGGPTAIGRFVIPVSIYPVERQFVSWFSHVIGKIFKYIPPFANFYILIGVVSSIFRSWFASAMHSLPCRIKLEFGLRTFRSRASMFSPGVDLKTAARFGVNSLKVVVGWGRYSPTVTQTFTASSVNSWHIINHQKSSKSLADKGFSFRHNVALSMFCQWRDSDCNPFPLRSLAL